LDSVFITLGPNYVAQSNEVGPNVCRVYEENTSVLKELVGKEPPEGLGRPVDREDEAKMTHMINKMIKENPLEPLVTLRPLICKDVHQIQHEGLRNAQLKPKVFVRIHKATNLRVKQGFLQGSVEPKVIVDIPGKPTAKWSSRFSCMGGGDDDAPGGRFETTAASDGKHVEWNQDGMLEGYNYGDDLRVMVVDKNWVGFENHLGEGRIPGSDFYPDSFFAELPLVDGDKLKSNTKGATEVQDRKGASILLEVRVIEPMGKSEMWPPDPPMYAPVQNLNESDQETQRLANWDIHQNAKLAFADVNPNYQMNEDVWGAFETAKAIGEGSVKLERADWQPTRVKDECLMA